jgi:hypothetical protein
MTVVMGESLMAIAGDTRYNGGMERVVHKYASFAESEKAERRYYRNLSPRERMDIFFELLARHREECGEAAQGLARVYRVIERKPR